MARPSVALHAHLISLGKTGTGAVSFAQAFGARLSSMPMPDTLKGIDDLIHADFAAYRSSCFDWLLAATASCLKPMDTCKLLTRYC
jgi:hypothetical protein